MILCSNELKKQEVKREILFKRRSLNNRITGFASVQVSEPSAKFTFAVYKTILCVRNRYFLKIVLHAKRQRGRIPGYCEKLHFK